MEVLRNFILNGKAKLHLSLISTHSFSLSLVSKCIIIKNKDSDKTIIKFFRKLISQTGVNELEKKRKKEEEEEEEEKT